MKEREKCKTTSHHWPHCAKRFSRYHILKSGIWARWASPFCRFLASFSLENDVTNAILRTVRKWKCNISGVFCSICLKFCRVLELSKRISLDFKFRCYGNQNQNIVYYWKTKGLLFKERGFSKTIWNNTGFIITAGYIIFWRKISDAHFLLWENNILLFFIKSYYSRFRCHNNEIWNQVKFFC